MMVHKRLASRTIRIGSVAITAKHGMLSGGIMIAASILFISTAGRLLSDMVAAYRGYGDGADNIVMIALLMNFALIILGWRRYITLSREVDSRTEVVKRVHELAARDPLTGFLNRRSLAESGTHFLNQAGQNNKCVAMLMLDLDNFKNINDVHGHTTGDALLKSVAKEIALALPPSALIARLGGDEFLCAISFDTSIPGSISRIAERIVARLAQPIEADGIHLSISVSIGIACSDKDCTTIDVMMRRADIAMYTTKKMGRNGYRWFDTAMETELQLRSTMEQGLRVGIPQSEFVPFYEQQIDLVTGKLYGFEVLARWHSPKLGLIMPERFIPVAEEIGVIGDLSLSIIRQALEHGRDWDPGLILSVNISPAQLKDPWLAQKLLKVLLETGFPANRLEIEITESSLFENLELARSTIKSLKNQGIKLSLDDFGTGYSSLAHLRALPFDRIKIDRSFVITINDNCESAAIVTAIAGLGENLNLPITAEGIENESIVARLLKLGITKGQGWHFGKPMNITQTRKLLAEKNLLPRSRCAIQKRPQTDETSGSLQQLG